MMRGGGGAKTLSSVGPGHRRPRRISAHAESRSKNAIGESEKEACVRAQTRNMSGIVCRNPG